MTSLKVKRPLLLVVKVFKNKKTFTNYTGKGLATMEIANKAGDSHPGMTTLLLKLLPFRGLCLYSILIL
jgi:hypothetical protein